MNHWENFSVGQWGALAFVLLVAVIYLAVSLINDEPWGGIRW